MELQQLSSTNPNIKKILFFFSVLYSYVLFNNDSLILSDRAAYISNIENSFPVLISKFTLENSSIFDFLLSEPLYTLIAYFLYLSFSEAHFALSCFIGLISFLFAFSHLSKAKNNWLDVLFVISIIIMPLTLKNYIIHLRQGCAMALFYYFYNSTIKSRYIWIWLAPLIHGTFIFIVPIVFLNEKLIKDKQIRQFIFLIFILFVGLTFSRVSYDSNNAKLQSLDQYDDVVSGVGFVFWSIIFVSIFYLKKKRLFFDSFQIMLFFYLITYYMHPSFSARTLESSIPLVFSIYLNKNSIKHFFIVTFLFFFLVQFLRNPTFQL